MVSAVLWRLSLVVSAVLCICAPMPAAEPTGAVGSAGSETWVWQADRLNDEGVSYSDNPSFSFKMTAAGGKWQLGAYSPGTISFKNTQPEGYDPGWGQAASSSFGESWDLKKGITISARVKPVNESTQYSLCVYVQNSSTKGLPGDSAHLLIGWAVPDWVRIYDKRGATLRQTDPQVKYYVENEWFLWTLGVKRIGDTVAWDIWINGEHQNPDRKAPDESLHTLVFVPKDPAHATTGTYLTLGLARHHLLSVLDSVWDYVAITNRGVIPAWDGGSSIAKAAGPKEIPAGRDKGLVGSLYRAQALMKDKKHADAEAICDQHLGTKPVENDFRAKETLIVFKSRIAKGWITEAVNLLKAGRYEEAAKITSDSLAKGGAHLPQRYVQELSAFRVAALTKLGRIDEAVQLLRRILPGAATPAQKAGNLTSIGSICFDAKRYREALKAYKEVRNLKDAPEQMKAEAMYRSGLCYRAIGYHDSARVCMERVVRDYRDSPWARRARGEMHLWVR